MRIAVLTFEGFNELDSFVASAMLNRVKRMQALIVCPTERVTSIHPILADPALDGWRPAPTVIGGVLLEECQRLKAR
jgi:hypothetical protein